MAGALSTGPQLAAGEARAVDSRDLLKQGVYAVRADGARLRAPRVPEREHRAGAPARDAAPGTGQRGPE